MSLDGKSLSSIFYLAKRPLFNCVYTFAGITGKLTLEIAKLRLANIHKLAKSCRQVPGNRAVSYSMKQFYETPKIS